MSDPINSEIIRVPLAGTVKESLVCLHNGNRVPVSGTESYYGRFSEILIINRGVHEPLEEFCFQEVIKFLPEKPFMLELGAYWGHYSMWLKSMKPFSSVHMVEPEQVHINAGKKNFLRNGFKGTFIKNFVGNDYFTVDDYLEKLGWPYLNILHCDIQGYELEMINGAQESFRRELVDFAFISTHSQSIHMQCEKELIQLGFKIAVSADFDYESTSYDGFILAVKN